MGDQRPRARVRQLDPAWRFCDPDASSSITDSLMLQKFSAGFVCLAWSLWFGGLAAIFLFAAALFAKDRETALKAAPIMFLIFEKYQILIAAAALVGSLS